MEWIKIINYYYFDTGQLGPRKQLNMICMILAHLPSFQLIIYPSTLLLLCSKVKMHTYLLFSFSWKPLKFLISFLNGCLFSISFRSACTLQIHWFLFFSLLKYEMISLVNQLSTNSLFMSIETNFSALHKTFEICW